MSNLIDNLNDLHTTELGAERIRRNLNLLDGEDIVLWCKEAIRQHDLIMGLGKNWYVYKVVQKGFHERSLLPEFRGYGIGTNLMKKLFIVLREQGYSQTSLSVQKDNPAVCFYQSLGCRVIDDKPDHAGHEDFIMIKDVRVRYAKMD